MAYVRCKPAGFRNPTGLFYRQSGRMLCNLTHAICALCSRLGAIDIANELRSRSVEWFRDELSCDAAAQPSNVAQTEFQDRLYRVLTYALTYAKKPSVIPAKECGHAVRFIPKK